MLSALKTRPAQRTRTTAVLLFAVACAGLTGVACGGTAVATPHATPLVNSKTIVITEADNKKTVVVERDQTVRLELQSTYWTIGGSSDPDVLRPASAESASPSPGCVPGQGCGTVSATYQTLADGRSRLVASRVTCGEALACGPSNGEFAVLVIVQG
jgi:hypothetical protein